MKDSLKQCIKYFAAAGVFSMFINTLYLTFSLYMLSIYERVIGEHRMSTLWVITIIALMALFSLGILEFVRSRILVKVGVKMDALLSRRVLKAMLYDLGKVDTTRYNQGIKDVQMIRNYLSGNAIFAFFDFPWIFIYLGIIFLVHPVLGLTASGGALVILIIGIIQTIVSKDDMAAQAKAKLKTQELYQKSLRSSHLLHSMGMIKNSFNFFKNVNNKDLEIHHVLSRKNQILGAISVSFKSMMQVIIFGAGAVLVISGEAKAGVIIAASIIMGRALAPIDQAIAAWKQTSTAVSAFKNLDELLRNFNPGIKVDPEDLSGDIEVEDLSLEIKGREILKDINFSLKKGEILGLVGHNGAGKTCLCRTLLGMWKPTLGRVVVNGIDISDVDQDLLGSHIGYLPQAVELFPGSVGDNIARLGEFEPDDVIAAAEFAGAHDLILKFPKGYNTDIGEFGLTLSGGQRQRVGLARALYKEPKFIILDEPNSNLDVEGEKSLMEALKKIKAMGSTAVMITHKPELLYHVDKILILQQGKIKAFGPKDEVFSSMLVSNSENGNTNPASQASGKKAGR